MLPFHDLRRDALRRRYLEAWRKRVSHLPLEPLEAQIAAVISDHPEYIAWLESGDDVLDADFTPAGGRENPFLHLSLHLAIREQVATDRPRGIARVHGILARQLGDGHAAEHALMEPLAQTLWEAQRDGATPDEEVYRRRLERLPGIRDRKR